MNRDEWLEQQIINEATRRGGAADIARNRAAEARSKYRRNDFSKASILIMGTIKDIVKATEKREKEKAKA